MNDEEIDKLVSSILPGVVCIILLIFLLGMPEFVEWFKDKTILYLIWFFFSAPIAHAIIDRKLDEKSIVGIGVGVVFLVPYCYIAGLTLFDVVRSLLEVIVILSLYFTIFTFFKKNILFKSKP